MEVVMRIFNKLNELKQLLRYQITYLETDHRFICIFKPKTLDLKGFYW